MKLREAAETDADAIVTLWEELMQFHADLDPRFEMRPDASSLFRTFLVRNIAADTACVIVAEDGGRLVGYLMAMESERPPVFRSAEVIEILDLAVTRDWRRKGIGTRLVDRIKEWTHTRSIQDLEVRAATKNPTSNAFWRKMGAKAYLEAYYF